MAKNNALIQANKEIAKIRKDYEALLVAQIDDITSQVYAAFAVVLKQQYNWNAEKIATLFARTQTLWQEHCEDPDGMIALCEALTGISVRSE